MRVSRGPEPLRTPAQVSRIGYFRLATLLGLGPLVPDIRLDSPGARPPHSLGGGLPIVIEGRAVLERLLVCCDLYDLPRVVDPCHLERDKGGTRSQKAHLHAYVLGMVALVEKQVLYVADLLVVLVVDRVACEAVSYVLRKLVSARLALQGKYLHIRCCVPT